MSKLGSIKAGCLKSFSPVWKCWMQVRGVQMGSGFTAIGRPGVNRKMGSTIRLGDRVTLCSSGMANPVAEGGRCRLATVAVGAELVLADDVGLSSCVICCARSVVIGKGTIIGGGAMILDTDFHPRSETGDWLNDPLAVSRPVVIGEKCFIGARAIILKGVTIGDGAVVGAGAVVSRNVAAGDTVAGNPAVSVAAGRAR